MRTDELRDYQRSFTGAQKRAETARKKRDAAVIVALAEGMSHAKIAEATGLTRGRIGQIAGRR